MRCAAHRKSEENKGFKEGRTTYNINCLLNITLWLKYRACAVSLSFKMVLLGQPLKPSLIATDYATSTMFDTS